MESEELSRQKAEAKLLDREKSFSNLTVDFEQLEKRQVTLKADLQSETEKVFQYLVDGKR